MAAGTSNSRFVVPPDQNDVAKWVTDQDRVTKQVCQKFSAIDAFFVITSLVTYVFDLVTDCLLAWHYFHAGHQLCGMWTLVFVVLPTLTLQILSLRWYHIEGRQLCCSWTLVAHLTLLGPVERYISVLRHGLSARQSERPQSYQRLYQAQNDVSTLRLIEAFLESAPQMILQGYFSLTTQPINWLSGLSMAVSLLSLAWSVAVYSNTLRLAYRASHMTNWGSLVAQSFWHTCIVASRVTAIVIFATVFHGWTFLPVGLHWLLMTVWVMLQGPDFFVRWWENKLFSLVLGVIFIFCFLNLKDGRTRHTMWPFYILLLAENGVLVGLWYRERPQQDTLMIVATAIVFGGYLTGVMLMLVYYRCCHPSGPLHLCGESENKPETEQQDRDEVEQPSHRVFGASLVSPLFSNEGYDLSLESSWSGLVDSRRPDNCNPTFTASRYHTSSQQLNFEQQNVVRNPNGLCNKLFDTPLCGERVHDQSKRPSAACIDFYPVCNTIPLAQSECSAISESNVSGSQFGCVSLDYSSQSRSKTSQNGYDNAGFSIGSLMSSTSSKNVNPGPRLPSAAMSLPSVYPLSSTRIDIGVENHPKSYSSNNSSVFAITGMPSPCSSGSSTNLKQETSPVRYRVTQKHKPELRNSRLFDHTQSLQCIPQKRPVFHSSTLPLKAKMSKSRLVASQESLSSITSSDKPRPLSPLNAQSLWEESMIRFYQSFEDDDKTSSSGKSEKSLACNKSLPNELSRHNSPAVTSINSQNRSQHDMMNSSHKAPNSSSFTKNLSKATSIQDKLPANNIHVDSPNSKPAHNVSNHYGSSACLQSSMNQSTDSRSSSRNPLSQSTSHSSYSKRTSMEDSLLSPRSAQHSPSIGIHSTSCSTSLTESINSSKNSTNRSQFSNYSSVGSSQHNSHTKSHSLNSSAIQASQNCSSTGSTGVDSSLKSSHSADPTSENSTSFSLHSHINSSNISSSSLASASCVRSENSSSLHSPPLGSSNSQNRSSNVYSKNSSLSSRDSQLSSKSNSSQSKAYGRFSSEGYRTNSSGFQSSAVDDSMDFFDYSDDCRDQSKHTLSDLGHRLNLALDLNFTDTDRHIPDSITSDRFLPIQDTPWRTDYLSRIPTPILQQSLLSLYSASDKSLYEASRLNLTGYNQPMPRSAFSNTFRARQDGHPLTSKSDVRTPLKIYDLTKSPSSKSRFQQRLRQLSPQPTDSIPKLQLENYGSSPYRKIKKSRFSCSNGFEENGNKYIEDIKRLKSELENPGKIQGLRKSRSMSKSPLQHSDEGSSSKSGMGRDSFGLSNSNSEVWNEISYSDTTENIDPRTLSTNSSWHTPESGKTSLLDSTPDFSPIQRFELPPLTAGTGPLKSRQSYFSTPKAMVPGYDSPKVLEDQNLTNDSFFGVQVPKMTRSFRNSSSRTDTVSSQCFQPKTVYQNNLKDELPKNLKHEIVTNVAYKYCTTPRNNPQRY